MPQTYYLGSRSCFVTITAWAFIAMAALACISGLLQHATVASWLPALPGTVAAPVPSFVAKVLLAYLPWLVGAGLLVSVALLAAAVGLLLRLEWARRAFIGMLVVVIVANLAGLWLQHEMVQSLVESTLRQAPMPPSAADVFGGFVTAAKVMAAIVTLAACAMLGWIIRRLMSPLVRQEFA